MIVTQIKYFCDRCWKNREKIEAVKGWAGNLTTGHSCSKHFQEDSKEAVKVWPVKKTILKH